MKRLAALIPSALANRLELLADRGDQLIVKHQSAAMIPAEIHQHVISSDSKRPCDEGSRAVVRAIVFGHANRNFLQHIFRVVKRTNAGKELGKHRRARALPVCGKLSALIGRIR